LATRTLNGILGSLGSRCCAAGEPLCGEGEVAVAST
jgi:hypothetical protein